MQFIYIDKDKVQADMNAMHIMKNFDAQVLVKNNAEDAISYLQILSEVDLIICRDVINNDSAAKRILDYIKENRLGTELLVMGDVDVEAGPKVHLFPRKMLTKKLIEAVRTVLGNDADTKSQEEYFGVPIDHFEYMAQAPADLYLKMKKEGQEHFVKILGKDMTYESFFMPRYQEKGVTHIYIKYEDKHAFIDFVSNRLEKLLETHGVEEGELSLNVQEMVFSQLLNSGLDERSLKLAQKATDTILDAVKSKEQINKLLQNLYKTEGSYDYRHSYMHGLIAINILSQMDWREDAHKEYLLLAALFCDLFIKEEQFIQIRSQQELEQSDLKQSVRTKIENHAAQASEALGKLSNIPAEVARIVEQHHGSANGRGFQTSLTTQISPLSSLFILAEEFTVTILKSKSSKVDVPGFIEEVKERYRGKAFTKAIDGLMKCLS